MIKGIAALSMLVDHLCLIVVAFFPYAEDLSLPVLWYSILTSIGRLAFPLFCFAAVEGFLHTGNRIRYVIRIFLCTIVSEPAFDYAFFNVWLEFTQQNVLFTIVLGIIGIWMCEFIVNRISEKSKHHILCYSAAVLPLLALAYIAQLFNTDYSALGVLTIGLMYVLRKQRIFACLADSAVLALDVSAAPLQFFGFFSVLPVFFYSGKKGSGLISISSIPLIC